MKYEVINLPDFEFVEYATQECQEKNHVQQVAYSTYHQAFTQVCFTCQKVRTNILDEYYQIPKTGS